MKDGKWIVKLMIDALVGLSYERQVNLFNT